MVIIAKFSIKFHLNPYFYTRPKNDRFCRKTNRHFLIIERILHNLSYVMINIIWPRKLKYIFESYELLCKLKTFNILDYKHV